MMLTAEDVAVVRPGGRRVLDGVTCRLAPGRIAGILGPNGAGKSTLIETLAGLLAPAAGSVLLDARPLASLARQERARAVAYLPQARLVHWPLTARAVVGLGRLPHRAGPSGDSAADRAAIDGALAAMDLVAIAERPADRLSGGELARVLVARALAQEAPVILADEPTAGLDPAHALALFATLDRLAADGRTVAVALHDLSMAARFCHDVVLLADGRVAAAGPAGDVLTPAHLEPVFGVRLATGVVDGLPVVLPAAPLS